MDLKKCLEMEYMLVQRFMADSDFSEGVRAVLVDKGATPSWSPSTHGEVSAERVDWFFKSLPTDEKLGEISRI